MASASTLQSSWKTSIPVLISLVLFPAVVFYSVLLYTARNLPWLDDYDAVLNFANQWTALHSFPERFIYFLSAQHNEYKIFLAHGLVCLQLALTGHVNFTVLCVLGNLSILLLGVVLWKMFLPETLLERRLALFLPVSLLLFQYQYVETLNWPMPGLVNLPVVAFAIGCFYFLGRRTRASFAAAAALMVLGIASSANGFLIAFVGMVLLLAERQYLRVAGWIATTGLCAWLYAFHYHTSAEPGQSHSLLHALMHPQLIFVLGFLGAAGRYPFHAGAVVLGVALVVFYGWIIRMGYLREQPIVGYCLLFVFLTGVGVAGIRADLGLVQSMSSRYRIYSDLLLIFAWFGLVSRYRLAETESLRRNPLFVTTLALCALFWVAMDAVGGRNLHRRDAMLEQGMRRFEQSHGTLSPVYSIDGEVLGYPGFDEHARQIMIQTEQAGTFEPKPY
jgi:hypothetical protein